MLFESGIQEESSPRKQHQYNPVMKKAIVTITMGATYEHIASMTHASQRAYADRIGAEFIVINKQLISQTSPHFEKFQIYDLLNIYHRIAFIDTDIIIRDDCPDVFELVPETHFGIFNEGKYLPERASSVPEIAKAYEVTVDKAWDRKSYYNTGVMVLSRRHKDIFKKPEKEIWSFYEQSYINLKLINNLVKVFELPYQFNRMCCMDKLTGEHRLKSYMVHYAGVLDNLSNLIPIDLAVWESGEYKNYKDHLIIGIGNNRLGDNVAVEPVVRKMMDSVDLSKTNVTIAAWFPRVFAHYEDRAHVCEFANIKYAPGMAYKHIDLAVDEYSKSKDIMTCDLMHMLDYTSIVGTRRVLPDVEKTIRLVPSIKGLTEVIESAESSLAGFILVHPGKAWESKTFPKEWWNSVISLLHQHGNKVAIIGSDMTLDRGTVDVDVPEGVLDLRNLLSLDGLFSAIQAAHCLVTNDSAPLHIAGAFDNHIILIPTCKHPDLIMPYRHGSKYYNAKALVGERRLFDENIKLDLNDLGCYNIEKVPGGDLTPFLPAPELVLQAVMETTN